MTLRTELYSVSHPFLPVDGQHIVAHHTEKQVVVYQAYNSAIARFAVENQYLGGPSFSYGRMSWIKPNFLWMMYRCGWASKENQERVLALWLDKAAFEEILSQAVFSNFMAGNYESEETWKRELATKNVRLQWDPDHSPYGDKLIRRALQLGLKNEALEQFGKYQVTRIEDVTGFVQQQKIHVANRQLEHLHIPQERVYLVSNATLAQKIGITPLAT
ncbi:DUF4291 domain-containing protein [Hymenobacter sp. H14-R3]|uniref:DUF4291 domain-containing protein n=1 Tax=Hymenobacter sp. H14-R3 TaxID=3046308 RepID=UPI0024B8CC0F|nr:DUF4291 domain-containing protein [Hymenobacter sp. H14-R3]MDJ0363942.1 DUF4291 domain-containing protein [Hymenobacter sp. H14-R3]